MQPRARRQAKDVAPSRLIEQTCRDIVARLPAALYTCDAGGRVTFYNLAAVELWGREPVVGRDLWCGSWRIYRPDGRPLPLDECPMAVALREGRPVRGEEIVIERPDGVRRHVRPHPNPIFDKSGALLGAVNLLLDVTPEEEEADKVRRRLAAIVESSDDAIVSKDLTGIITSWNRGAERLFGYSAEEAVGRSITMLIPKERLHEEPEVLARIRRGESIDHYETVRQRKDGSPVDISLTVSPIVDASGRITGASKIARDITDRKRAEQALREADVRKDEFLATLAHELRGPLAPLANSLELLRVAGPDAPMPRDVLETMERQVAHLTRLMEDLLDVSRIKQGKVELRKKPLPLASAVQAAIEISRPLIDAGAHRLEISLSGQTLLVDGDQTRLTQVIANLLNNAAKFTPARGLIRLTLERDGAEAVVRVADSGAGIPKRMLAKIFEIFAQGPAAEGAARGGLGIGLALVRRLVELHNGTVEARSDGPGRGSEFAVRLPLIAQVHETHLPPVGNLVKPVARGPEATPH
jgi:PAS domain S-box-containing protein